MSSHYKPGEDFRKDLVIKQDGKWTIKPQALDIIWGNDPRYWRIPHNNPTAPVELLQVSWLEVTGWLELEKLTEGQNYKVSFKLELKPDAFGWTDSPVYLMAKPGKGADYIWKKSNLSARKNGPFYAPTDTVLKFTAPKNPVRGDKLQFGMYEIWKGRWKGGLVIHEVVIEPCSE